MFRNRLCGVNTKHRHGFVFQSKAIPNYLLMCFQTPFFYEIDGKRIEGNAGDCLLHAPKTPVTHGPISENEMFINDWIYFSAEEEDAEILQFLPLDTIIPIPDPALFERLIVQIGEESVRRDSYSPRLISDAIFRLLTLLKRSDNEPKNDDNTVYAAFKELRVHILNRCGEEWTLAKMAKLSSYSVSRFCALYTAFFGKSPIDDLLDKRLESAKHLLALHVYKVGDVAEMCGFSSIHYFSAFFKKRTGKAPSEY